MIGAVVLAAGLSRRMGRPKMVLPWGAGTVIGRVVAVLDAAGVDEIVVVTGGARQQVEAALRDSPARAAFNPDFANGEMSRTLQVGLAALGPDVDAALVTLGDQPQIETAVVRAVLAAWRREGERLVVPSYRMRRGHPWLVARPLWDALLAIAPPETLRDFLNRHLAETVFVTVETPSVLHDLDTPEDYRRFRPSG